MLNSEVKRYLQNLEKEGNFYPVEAKIGFEITKILNKDKKYQETKEDFMEATAFFFSTNRGSPWETYYGPMSVSRNACGQMIEFPSIQRVNKETLQYWEKRVEESKNPMLSSRYADLVIDFSLKISREEAKINLFQKVIDLNIIICKESLTKPTNCRTKIKRALDLAIRMEDQARISKAKDTQGKLNL